MVLRTLKCLVYCRSIHLNIGKRCLTAVESGIRLGQCCKCYQIVGYLAFGVTKKERFFLFVLVGFGVKSDSPMDILLNIS